MAVSANDKPIFDKRVNFIIDELSKNRSREDISKELDYSSYRSLDMYMRRKNFSWDSDKGNYVPKHSRIDEEKKNSSSSAPVKVSRIISLFDSDSPDPRAIARSVGLSDHRELANYMEKKGYIWSPEKRNYVKRLGKIEGTQPSEGNNEDAKKAAPPTNNVTPFRKRENSNGANLNELDSYLPLLDYLIENRDRLVTLIEEDFNSGQIPKYAVPGTTKTKSIYMSELLADLVTEFSRSKNVTQRELVEAALIEYFNRYGFENEVKTLLKSY